jgi:pimeloyl-ACP methyl ester carboxylesterase
MVPTRYGDTFVLVFGRLDGPPLVLLHGATSHSAMWLSDAAAYAARFRVFAVDILGEAGKSTPRRLPWRGPHFSDWLGDVFDGLGLASASIVAVSQGGWLALKFAVAAPSRVESLVLFSPGGVVRDSPFFTLRALIYVLMRQRGAGLLARMVYAPEEPPPGAAETALFMARNFRTRMGLLPQFGDEELRRISGPVLLVGGDGDRLRDVVAIRNRLSRLLPQLQSILLPGTGHVISRTADHALAFLEASVDAKSGSEP